MNTASGVQVARTATIPPPAVCRGGWDVHGSPDGHWEAVPDYEGLYEANTNGDIRSLDREVKTRGGTRIARGRVLKPRVRADQYRQVGLHSDGVVRYFLVHGVIAATFFGPKPEGWNVCHWDGDKSNNSVSNLRYDTPSGNQYDNVRLGTHAYAAATHCVHGHPWDEANTYRHPTRGHRVCRQCRARRKRLRSCAQAQRPR